MGTVLPSTVSRPWCHGGLGRRFPSWTRHLCLLLETVVVPLLDIGPPILFGQRLWPQVLLAQHISKRIGDTSVCDRGRILSLELIVLATLRLHWIGLI
ncbi:UNVERIFIED_CONTAM: hypothetical protein Sradi_4386800 [Sesamum radiatum]|uniref:Uncharacterized protein n=1 Tax=Sesamum radiatum TaxID=300843 RepID=A0AAW2NNV2_SESRA